MKRIKKVDLELFEECYNNFEELYGENFTETEKKNELANSFDINIRTVYKLIAKLNNSKLANEDVVNIVNNDCVYDNITDALEEYTSPDKKQIHRLSEENKNLKKLLEQTKNKVFDSSDIRDIIMEVKNTGFDTIPKWVNNSKDIDTLVPVLFLTDIHMGEVVNSKEIGFTEDYNTEIAIKSVNQLTDDFINISVNKMSNYKYPGCVLMLGGDGITNDIHGLLETNDTTPIRQVISLTSLYIQQIEKLHKAFGKVLVAGCTGNHSRLDIRHSGTKTKLRTETSLETIAYHFVKQHFINNEDINIVYNESDEVLFAINGRRFNLQHGDRGIKGGGGIGGIVSAVKRARAKLLQSAVSMGKTFDTLVIGHFHQHFIADDIIIGASTKCYDEYCKAMGFGYNEAGATSFFVNSHGDIIYATHLKIRQNKEVIKKEKCIELF